MKRERETDIAPQKPQHTQERAPLPLSSSASATLVSRGCRSPVVWKPQGALEQRTCVRQQCNEGEREHKIESKVLASRPCQRALNQHSPRGRRCHAVAQERTLKGTLMHNPGLVWDAPTAQKRLRASRTGNDGAFSPASRLTPATTVECCRSGDGVAPPRNTLMKPVRRLVLVLCAPKSTCARAASGC